uniref:Uncharacterized protein n=1 Tax=Setaria viridis TaxID=4556 RepID=A0A4U6V1Z1_SETVI|nr:hypothetical protein SEVIR_4G169500v2 [Setaria viridis]
MNFSPIPVLREEGKRTPPRTKLSSPEAHEHEDEQHEGGCGGAFGEDRRTDCGGLKGGRRADGGRTRGEVERRRGRGIERASAKGGPTCRRAGEHRWLSEPRVSTPPCVLFSGRDNCPPGFIYIGKLCLLVCLVYLSTPVCIAFKSHKSALTLSFRLIQNSTNFSMSILVLLSNMNRKHEYYNYLLRALCG